MRILLSAYACEPNRGSDMEVGWQWAVNLARAGHDVWVMTRAIHRAGIEMELAKLDNLENLHIQYVDIDWFISATNWFKGRIYIYYYLWQWEAAIQAKQLHKEHVFEVVQHVTWVTVRQPSFMWRIGIPFIYGPCAGGESAPLPLRTGYSLRQWIADVVRDIANKLVAIDPLMHKVFRSADRIYVTSEQTLNVIPGKYHGKTAIRLAIGLGDAGDPKKSQNTGGSHLGSRALRILYVGRFIGWKGMYLGLRAFARLVERHPDARLTMVGRGVDETALRQIAQEEQLAGKITWMPWVDKAELSGIYNSHDCFLFPSLHDSGGLVVLEAMRAGLPVVALKLGGPGVIVNDQAGYAIDVVGKGCNEVVEELATALGSLAGDADLRVRMSDGARQRVAEFGWDNLVQSIYERG